MNALDFLRKEHQQVRAMLKDISDESHHFETQKKRFEEMAHVLVRHEYMEHDEWYPHFKDRLPSTVKHLIKEENIAEQEIKKMLALKTEEDWRAHFAKFMHAVEHHADEEEHELFPEVKKILSKQELDKIGEAMHRYKKTHLH